jgi:hypothetical protein
MAKHSLGGANIKNLGSSALLAIGILIVAVFAFSLGFIGGEYSGWLPLIIIALLAVIAVPVLRKTNIERYYEAIAAAHGDIKPPRKLKRRQSAENIVYTFRMPAGMSKSQYEKYKEGLEQYLDSKVEFRFEHNLIITVTGEPPEE